MRRHFLFVVPAGLALAAFALAGCGFQPLYAARENAGPASALAEVYVSPIPERVGYELRNDLIDLFNAGTDAGRAAYRLDLMLNEAREPLALKGNASITRYNYRLVAHYSLVVTADEKTVKQGDVRTLAAYNVAESPYATVAGEQDAESRAAESVAERIRTELAVYFRNGAGVDEHAELASPATIP